MPLAVMAATVAGLGEAPREQVRAVGDVAHGAGQIVVLHSIPWVWTFRPVMMDARAGVQTGHEV